MAFYQRRQHYPAEYDGALFFADYSRDCIWVMGAGRRRRCRTRRRSGPSAPAPPSPVDLQIGPDGDLFYADFDGGTIRRIHYTAGNQPPRAVIERHRRRTARPR